MSILKQGDSTDSRWRTLHHEIKRLYLPSTGKTVIAQPKSADTLHYIVCFQDAMLCVARKSHRARTASLAFNVYTIIIIRGAPD